MSKAGPSRRALIGLAGAWALAGPGHAQGRPRYILATGAAGGAFHEYGPVLAAVLSRHAQIDLDIQQTAGSNDNIRAVGAGEADLGLVNLGPAYRAWKGSGAFEAAGPQQTLRALFPMYQAPLALVALKTAGIRTLADLKGRMVGIGPAGSPGEIVFKALVKTLSIEPRMVKGAPAELARKLLAGEIDALWVAGRLPVAEVVEVAERADVVVLGLTDAEVVALRGLFPFFTPGTIPAGTYRGQDARLGTASVWNFVLASDRLGEEAAYVITSTALAHPGEFAAEVSFATGTRAAHALANTFLPFHPGALRYYREAGIAIPDALSRG